MRFEERQIRWKNLIGQQQLDSVFQVVQKSPPNNDFGPALDNIW